MAMKLQERVGRTLTLGLRDGEYTEVDDDILSDESRGVRRYSKEGRR